MDLPTTDRRRPTPGRERAILVGVHLPGVNDDLDDPLDELAQLADTAGSNVVGRVVQPQRRD